jgi:2-polyprenyl-3-methyl-5-hydroxy-6-metoxy-1,4-benzoquinol methylase
VNTFYDDRYGYPGKFKLIKCRKCNHLFLECNFTVKQLEDLYSNYYPRSSFDIKKFKPYQALNELKLWFDGAKRAYSLVPPNVRVLDIGCGFGESLGYHTARGCDVYGVEADENIRRVADKFGFKVHVGLFDPELYEPAFFDYVTMDQVIEHVTEPLETFRGIAKVLKPGGVAVLSTPNANGWGAKIFRNRWINWHAPYHIQFFSKKSLQLVAEQAGLKVTKIETVTSSAWLLYQWIHLFIYPQPGRPSAFWDTTAEKSFRVKLLLSATSRIHRTKINHLITRLFDALGLGDNYLFTLEKR